jgi:outer membrane murein-binding lipoprotein Lpp
MSLQIAVSEANVFLRLDPAAEAKIDQLLALVSELNERVSLLQQQVQAMTPELQRLQTEVSEMKTVNQSAIALIGGLADQIRALKDDPAALASLADELDASTNALAAAVQANTPTPPEPAPEPTPPETPPA